MGYERAAWISKRHCAALTTSVSWHDAIGNSDLKKECCQCVACEVWNVLFMVLWVIWPNALSVELRPSRIRLSIPATARWHHAVGIMKVMQSFAANLEPDMKHPSG